MFIQQIQQTCIFACHCLPLKKMIEKEKAVDGVLENSVFVKNILQGLWKTKISKTEMSNVNHLILSSI